MTKNTDISFNAGLSENKKHCFLTLCFFFASSMFALNLSAQDSADAADDVTKRTICGSCVAETTSGASTVIAVGGGGTGLASLTAFSLLIGEGASPVQFATPGNTGIPLVSTGAASNPAFGTALVLGGGTGKTSFTGLNQLVASGTTTTSLFQQVTGGATSLPLVSQGAATLPAFAVLTVPGGGSGVATFAGLNQLIASGTTATSAEQQVTGGATGLPLVSQGAATLPAFGVLTAPGGGTGAASFAALNSVVLSGTTTTSAFQQVTGGASGTILTSAGAATAPTFQALSANVRVFTTAGIVTYTPTSGTKYAVVEAVGGGAGSGSVAGTTFHASAGAGSGSYSRIVLTAGQIGAVLLGTVGAGGLGGASGAANTGATGTASSLAALITAPAGLLSAAGGAGAQTGGAGGALGTGGMIAGFAGQGQIAGAVGVPVGAGGNSPIGFGQGGYPTVMLTTALAGQDGKGFGSGASGASAGQAGTSVAGGTGAGGAIIVTEYILA